MVMCAPKSLGRAPGWLMWANRLCKERDVYVLDRIAYTANTLKYILWLPLLIYKAKP